MWSHSSWLHTLYSTGADSKFAQRMWLLKWLSLLHYSRQSRRNSCQGKMLKQDCWTSSQKEPYLKRELSCGYLSSHSRSHNIFGACGYMEKKCWKVFNIHFSLKWSYAAGGGKKSQYHGPNTVLKHKFEIKHMIKADGCSHAIAITAVQEPE